VVITKSLFHVHGTCYAGHSTVDIHTKREAYGLNLK